MRCDKCFKNINKNHFCDSLLDVFEECLKKYDVKTLSKKLNLSTGTIKRWKELKNVPPQYTFDIYKILSKEIEYDKYSSSFKDQFFTPKSVVEECWNIFNSELKINIDDYVFIEPSAGDGSFLKILPKGTIGLDIEPHSNDIIKQDYLTWKPDETKKYIVFGNPPFGLRGHLALNFINHSSKFADYVCFILPQLFESDGKGTPRKRVIEYNLIYSKKITTLFYTPEKQNIKINCVFQIWSKHSSSVSKKIENNKIKVYSLSDGGSGSTTRNKKMIGNCDVYIPSTCFGKENMKIYKSFEELPNRKGYGVVFLENKNEMVKRAEEINWVKVCFLSTNSALNLRTSLIISQFI